MSRRGPAVGGIQWRGGAESGAMKDHEKLRGWTAAILLVIALVLLPLHYVLSTGPALWLENHEYLAVGILGKLYYPIAVACESSPTINRAFVWYWRYWT